MVDSLATLSAMLQVNRGQEITIHIQQQVKMAHYQHLDQDEIEAGGKPWYHDIKEMLMRLTTGFFLNEAIFYKRSTNLTLFHYVLDREAKKIMKEVHEGAFGTHTNDHALARKILRVSYY
ncbi:hypothetical protein CR513_41646, partial [Mucuna pruriens]